jgi:hypothetical protein
MFSLFEGSKNGGNGCVSSSGKQGTFPRSSSRGTSASEQKLVPRNLKNLFGGHAVSQSIAGRDNQRVTQRYQRGLGRIGGCT